MCRERKCVGRVWRERECVCKEKCKGRKSVCVRKSVKEERGGSVWKEREGRVCEKREIGGECGER